mmetsp:Transcript_5764/g.14766  ORF Transcript_5764/g.14766 Transcript_5764/m.14766 type:complete len:212 (+) Transcript_5764:221-856(+)
MRRLGARSVLRQCWPSSPERRASRRGSAQRCSWAWPRPPSRWTRRSPRCARRRRRRWRAWRSARRTRRCTRATTAVTARRVAAAAQRPAAVRRAARPPRWAAWTARWRSMTSSSSPSSPAWAARPECCCSVPCWAPPPCTAMLAGVARPSAGRSDGSSSQLGRRGTSGWTTSERLTGTRSAPTAVRISAGATGCARSLAGASTPCSNNNCY